MKKLILLSLVLLFAPLALAQDTTTFAWDLSDSEPLGTGGGYSLYASKQSGVYDESKIYVTVDAGINTVTVPNPGWGRFCFVADCFAYDATEGEIRSDFSNEVCLVFKPNPPGNLRNTVDVVLAPIKKVGSLLASVFKGQDQFRLRTKE